jgi:hypothetical protein
VIQKQMIVRGGGDVAMIKDADTHQKLRQAIYY